MKCSCHGQVGHKLKALAVLFMYTEYWLSTYYKLSLLYCWCLSGHFFAKKKASRHPMGYHTAPFQQAYHGATEKSQGQPRKWRAPSITYAKLCQVSVACTIFALAIYLHNQLYWKVVRPSPTRAIDHQPSVGSLRVCALQSLHAVCSYML